MKCSSLTLLFVRLNKILIQFRFKYKNILRALQNYASIDSGLNWLTNCFLLPIYPSNSHCASIMCSNSNILVSTGRYNNNKMLFLLSGWSQSGSRDKWDTQLQFRVILLLSRCICFSIWHSFTFPGWECFPTFCFWFWWQTMLSFQCAYLRSKVHPLSLHSSS